MADKSVRKTFLNPLEYKAAASIDIEVCDKAFHVLRDIFFIGERSYLVQDNGSNEYSYDFLVLNSMLGII